MAKVSSDKLPNSTRKFKRTKTWRILLKKSEIIIHFDTCTFLLFLIKSQTIANVNTSNCNYKRAKDCVKNFLIIKQ